MIVILGTRSHDALNTGITLILSVLLVGALVSSVLEISFTNVCILVSLFTLLAGETIFLNRPKFWARWFSQAGAILQFPGRAIWAWQSTIRLLPSSSAGMMRIGGWAVGVLLPVLLLTLLFSIILGAGNAILGTWVNQLVSKLWNWITSFDLSFGRMIFWVFIALLSLALIRPTVTGQVWWGWMGRVVRFSPPAKPSQAYWRSVLILVALNAIFFAANSIDCCYLWAHQDIPQGVTYSQYVHEGTAQLIAATLLSAVVLTFLFNQNESLSGRTLLRVFALLWIGQNLFLLTSIALRLKLYVDVYSLTSQRISVLIFLLLVAGGFILLSCKIIYEKSLLWLLGANAALLFSFFYIVEFADLEAMAAGYNVSRWEKDPTHQLDINYLQTIGSSGWAALVRVAERTDRVDESLKATGILDNIRSQNDLGNPGGNWRSWQARRAWNLHNLSLHL
jgi:hypothetical protein